MGGGSQGGLDAFVINLEFILRARGNHQRILHRIIERIF